MRGIVIVSALVFMSLSIVHAGAFQPEKQAVVLAGFESVADVRNMAGTNVQFAQTQEFATEGACGLKMMFDAKGKSTIAYLLPASGGHFDLSDFALISVDAASGNPGSGLLGFSLYQTQEKQFSAYFTVPAEGGKTISLDLRKARESGLDLTKIARIDFYVPTDYGYSTVFVDNLRLVPEGHISLDALFHDTFGKADPGSKSPDVWRTVKIGVNPAFGMGANQVFPEGQSITVRASSKGDHGAWARRIPVARPGESHSLTCVYSFTGAEAVPYVTLQFLDVEYRPIGRTSFRLGESLGRVGGSSVHSASFDIPGNATDMEIILGLKDGKGELSFQAVRLDRLTPKPVLPQTWNASWIWCSEPASGKDEVHARTAFTLPEGVKDAYLQATADNVITGVYVNGKSLDPGRNSPEWKSSDIYDITGLLRPGRNVIAIHAVNADGLAGLIYEASLNLKDGQRIPISSGADTRVSRRGADGWSSPEFDDTQWPSAQVFGRPPIPPWGNLEFKYIGSKTRVQVVRLNAPDSAAAGDAVDVLADLKPLDAAESGEEMHITLYDGETPASSAILGLKTGKWVPGKSVTAGPARLLIPRFLKKGEYRIVLEAPGMAFENGTKTLKITREAPVPPQPTVRIMEHQGAPTVFINGKPMYYMSFTTLGSYNYGKNPVTFYNGKFQKQAADAGIHVFSFSSVFKWDGEGQYDFTENDKTIAKIMETDPDAYVMIKLSSLFSGPWWFDANPGELIVDADGRNPFPNGISYASKKYREDYAKAVTAHLEHIKNGPYADRVIGYMVAGFSVEEWLHFGEMDPEVFTDYNPQVRDMFRAWLREEYGNDVSALRRAWRNDTVDFDTAQLPGKEERARSDFFSFRDPAKSQNVIDFTRFFGHLSADTVLWSAKTFKEATDGKLMVGVHYGYIPELSSSTARLQNAGHLGFYEVLQSPYIDFYVSPQSYSDREVGQTSSAMIPAASVTGHGRMHYIESDPRTFLSDPSSSYGRTDTLRDTIEVLRREFAINLCTESNISWLALGDDWYDNKGLLDTIGEMQRIGDASMDFDRSSAAEVAVIVDEGSAAYLSLHSPLPRPMIYDIRYALNRMGAPYDVYVISDLENVPLKQYNLVIFVNAWAPGEKQREYIKSHVADGRTVLWMYAPGFIRDGEFSLDSMRDLTGITIAMRDIEQPLRLTTDLPSVSAFDEPYMVGPVFYADDPEARVLGRLNVDDLPGLAVKGRSVYLAVPFASPGLLRTLAREAGAHIYSDMDEALYANHRLLAVHTASAGTRRFSLPKSVHVYDVFADKVIARNTKTLEADLRPNATRIYFLGTQAEIERFKKSIYP